MLHKAVADPHALSVQPTSLGARFQLLLLCMKFIQAGVCDPVCEVLLRERLYASSFTWFYYEPMWYHVETTFPTGEDRPHGSYTLLYLSSFHRLTFFP